MGYSTVGETLVIDLGGYLMTFLELDLVEVVVYEYIPKTFT